MIDMSSNGEPSMNDDDQKIVPNFAKFRLLMWKNCLIQYRHPIHTVFDVMAPVLFTLLLVMIRIVVDPTVTENNTLYESFEINTLDRLR